MREEKKLDSAQELKIQKGEKTITSETIDSGQVTITASQAESREAPKSKTKRPKRPRLLKANRTCG